MYRNRNVTLRRALSENYKVVTTFYFPLINTNGRCEKYSTDVCCCIWSDLYRKHECCGPIAALVLAVYGNRVYPGREVCQGDVEQGIRSGDCSHSNLSVFENRYTTQGVGSSGDGNGSTDRRIYTATSSATARRRGRERRCSR